MEVREVLFNFLKGRHTFGQMFNLVKYFFGRKKEIVNWDPIYISVFPTFKCNFNCDMCITHSKKFENPLGQKTSGDIDFQNFQQIVNRYKNAIIVNLIGNGEALLNRDVFKMIEYASKVMKMYVYSGSNGVIVGDNIEKILNSSLRGFFISLNGHNHREFNRMTGVSEKYFDVICNNITELIRRRNLKKSKVEILVSIILDKENYRYLNDMAYFVDSLGADRILFFQFVPTPAPGFTAEERCLFSDDIDVLRTFSQARSLPSKLRRKISLPPLLHRTMSSHRNCTIAFYNVSVDGDLNVGFCCQSLDYSKNGKYYEDDAWNNDHFKDMRRRFIDASVSPPEYCSWCYNNVGDSRLISNPNPLFTLVNKIIRKAKNK